MLIKSMLELNKEKKIKLSNFKNIYWYLLKKQNFLILTNNNNIKKYIIFPIKLNFILKNKTIYFLNYFDFTSFYLVINKWIETFYKPLQKKLIFKGLGFKFKYSTKKKNILELKLGFSHLISILVPYKELKVFLIKKNRIAIESFNYSLVGNFAHKIRMLRFPDSFNGKGFWYKNEIKVLKQVKKT